MTGPHPAVAAQRTAVRAALTDLPDDALVLVACSGGADSLALAAAAAFVAPRRRLRAGAVVVDHGLQDGSAEAARVAAATCTGLGLDPVEVVTLSGDEVAATPGGPEAAARHARYEAIEVVAHRVGAAAVLLGHTLDDQAETVLLGLARGSGARSLAGMPAARGLLRRPFLTVRRAQTEAACDALGLAVWHDPTNDDGGDAPLRSRVRHRVLPVMGEVLGDPAPALARTAEQLRADDEVLTALALDLLSAAVVAAEVDGPSGDDEVTGETRVDLDLDVLAGAPQALRHRALHAAVARVGCPPGSVRRSQVLDLDALVVQWHGQGPVDLPGGGQGRRACGRLTLCGPGPDRAPGAAAQRMHDRQEQ